MSADLSELAASFVQRQTRPFAFCGIGIAREGARQFHVKTASGIRGDEHSRFRAASISKIVTGQVAERAVRHADAFDRTVEDILGIRFRAPDGSQPKPSDLASHQAGMTDAGGYVIPPEMSLVEWLQAQGGAIWSGASVGAQFEYSNLGFIVLAACAEHVSGQNFAALSRAALDQAGVQDAAFNWAGLDDVAGVLPTYRLVSEGQFEAQIDDSDDQIKAAKAVASCADICPHALSPQGGLRISLDGLLRLGRALKSHPTHDGWANDPTRTIGPTELFQSYAWGAQIFHAPAFYPRPLIGHFANAYGFCGGLWWDAARDVTFAYALNGLPMGDEDDGLRPEELRIFEAVSQAL